MASDRVASHGRGGAGNITKDDPSNHPKAGDLVTPSLKSETYTTGRGGTGNMAHNHPERPQVTRAAQDVETPPQSDASGPQHYGRGGAANVTGQSSSAAEARREEDGAGKGLLNKGKEILNKLGKK